MEVGHRRQAEGIDGEAEYPGGISGGPRAQVNGRKLAKLARLTHIRINEDKLNKVRKVTQKSYFICPLPDMCSQGWAPSQSQ